MHYTKTKQHNIKSIWHLHLNVLFVASICVELMIKHFLVGWWLGFHFSETNLVCTERTRIFFKTNKVHIGKKWSFDAFLQLLAPVHGAVIVTLMRINITTISTTGVINRAGDAAPLKRRILLSIYVGFRVIRYTAIIFNWYWTFQWCILFNLNKFCSCTRKYYILVVEVSFYPSFSLSIVMIPIYWQLVLTVLDGRTEE
jgi:hypothetical protein